MSGRMVSLLFALYFRIEPGEWLIGLVLAWWGWIRHQPGKPSIGLYTAALLVVLLGQIARWRGYHHFVPGSLSIGLGALPQGGASGVVVGDLYGYLHPDLPLLAQRFHLGSAARLFWQDGARPPRVLLVTPPSARLPILHESGANWAEWYPGSSVEEGTIYVRGEALPALRLSFAGRQLVIGCDDEAALAEVAGRLSETA